MDKTIWHNNKIDKSQQAKANKKHKITIRTVQYMKTVTSLIIQYFTPNLGYLII